MQAKPFYGSTSDRAKTSTSMGWQQQRSSSSEDDDEGGGGGNTGYGKGTLVLRTFVSKGTVALFVSLKSCKSV